MSPDGARLSSPISGLAGLIVWTAPDRFEAMRDFYIGALDLEPRSERDSFVSFGWGASDARAPRLTITVHSQVDGRTRDPLRVMINLEVRDIASVHARLVERGVRFVRPPEREHFGGWVATFEDPDGNLVQLLEDPRS